ncbi:heat shock 70 kDa protein BIP5-like [Oryza brachyantha]|uniref:Uncharacterized protein n=1 Tax=Oryza brachyantha TaxID=4533 RepID=J3KVJ0_ORYBR|nr:heat shock 70 kDa protein BIP5-like [Oryza brachyantha]
MKLLPFAVVDKGGMPHVRVDVKDGAVQLFSPEEISAMRQATKDAATITSLTVDFILNKPTAAALPYGISDGMFNVSIRAIDDSLFEVAAMNGDTHLSGEDFDQRVMEYFIKLIQRNDDRDITDDAHAQGKLRREGESAKRVLSSQH